MSEAFIGEIKMVGGNFAPSGWTKCEGQLLPGSDLKNGFHRLEESCRRPEAVLSRRIQFRS